MIAAPPRTPRRVVRKIGLLPSQRRFLVGCRRAPVALFVGGWGCGKTDVLGHFVSDEAIFYERNYIGVAAATYPQLRRSTIRKTLDVLNRRAIKYRYWKSEKRIEVKATGSEIEFLSCDIPPEEQQGPEFGALAVDEGEGVSQEHWQRLFSRVRKPGTSLRKRIFCNPPHRSHWIARDFFGLGLTDWRLPHGWAVVQATTYENGFLPADYIRGLEHMYGVGSRAWRRYMMGEVGLPVEGAIYPEFNDRDHVISFAELDALRRTGHVVGTVCGFDLGGGHPTAFLQADLTDDDVLIVSAEHWANYLPVDEHLQRILTFYVDDSPIFADHELQTRIEYEMRGLPTAPAPKHVGVEQGIDAVRRRLVQRKLKVVRDRCPRTYQEFGGYQWAKPKNPGIEYRDAPVKLEDDCMDALRYLVTGLDQHSEGGDREVLQGMFATRRVDRVGAPRNAHTSARNGRGR